MTLHAPRLCLVTGCAGNVGSNLTKALLRDGARVVGLDDLSTGTLANMTDFQGNPAFAFHRRSITEHDVLTGLIREHGRFEAVFHLAAIISVPYSMDHPEETMAVNHQASLTLHAQARQAGVASFVFAGSAAEYGRPFSAPVREEDAGDPVSPYGVSKHLVSLAIAASGYGCSLRFFNIYGPTRAKAGPYDGVVRKFLERTGRGEKPVIFGDGGAVRDFLFLGDAVRALRTAAGLAPGGPLRGVFNVGTGRGTSVSALARRVMALAGLAGEPEFAPDRPGDIRFSVADNAKLRAGAGWVPETGLDAGLALTVEGMRALDAALPNG